MSDTSTIEAGKPIIVRSGAGRTVEAFGDSIHFMLGGDETGGKLAVGIVTVPPGGGPPPHIHNLEAEMFLVIEGRISVLVSGEWKEIGPGDVAFTPPGNAHAFRNVGDTVAKFWVVAMPSGFEKFFEKCSKLFAAGGEPDMPRIMEICAEHDIQMVRPE